MIILFIQKIIAAIINISSLSILIVLAYNLQFLQLTITGSEDRLKLSWHKQLVNGELPYTIGGGIGQSRLAMLLLQKKHIGEVQSSIWPQGLITELKEQNINLL